MTIKSSLTSLALVAVLVLVACAAPATSTPPTATPAATAPPTLAPIRKILICDDGAEWPPYTYYRRVNGEKTTEVIGYAVDVVNEIFSAQGISYTVELLPWKRCLAGVEGGTEFQMLLNASYSEERAQKYYLSQEFYVTNSYYFYSKQQHPDGLQINALVDLQKYQVCGILGYNYSEYGVPDVDTGTTDYAALIDKVAAGRCDLFMEKLEIMAGFSATGSDYLGNPDLAYAPIPGTKPAPFYMMFPKTPAGAQLKTTIDTGLDTLEKSGRLQELLKKYVP